MEFIRGANHILPKHRGSVVTIGNFDGVHFGHRAVISKIIEQAQKIGTQSTVVLFEPHPQEYFLKNQAPARLSLLRDKLEWLKQLGIQQVLCLKFNRELSNMTANNFIKHILVDGLAIQHLVIGDDFHFGKKRTGNFSTLLEAGQIYNFAVEALDSRELNGVRVSSTAIRKVLDEGNFQQARSWLGHAYCVTGRVFYGDARGRTIGFPTANIALRRQVSPLQGVFAVKTNYQGQNLLGVANIGIRPTVNGQHKQLEAHFFDFKGNLYGERLRVEIVEKIRDERKFENLETLVAQIKRDAVAARQVFSQT
ncbi:MAG: bifunctional riboflavin kinase/FAD synthetase [Pseudomonadota bacterium]